jgi:SPX domain protein involved in polyphosphate accumulation
VRWGPGCSILEIKLQDVAPPFIQELLDGGMLTEVTKFSKFLSGCAGPCRPKKQASAPVVYA